MLLLYLECGPTSGQGSIYRAANTVRLYSERLYWLQNQKPTKQFVWEVRDTTNICQGTCCRLRVGGREAQEEGREVEKTCMNALMHSLNLGTFSTLSHPSQWSLPPLYQPAHPFSAATERQPYPPNILRARTKPNPPNILRARTKPNPPNILRARTRTRPNPINILRAKTKTWPNPPNILRVRTWTRA